MKDPNPFVTKFATSIIAVLACFDRVIFKGQLPFQDETSLNRFVDHALRIPRKDFLPFLEGKSDELVAHAKSLVEQYGAPYYYLQGRHRKEDLVQQIIRERRLSVVIGMQKGFSRTFGEADQRSPDVLVQTS